MLVSVSLIILRALTDGLLELLLRREHAAVVHLALTEARRQRLLVLHAQLGAQVAVLG